MVKKVKVVLALILAVMMVFSLLAGCSAKKAETPSKETQAAATVQKASTDGAKLPISDKLLTLTCFWEMDPKTGMSLKSMNEMGMFKELEKRTNIHIDFKHPPVGQSKEQLNLMIASGDMTDLVFYQGFLGTGGGPTKLLADKVFVKLNDAIDKDAPYFKKALAEHPDWKKQLTLEDGSIYHFPTIKTDPFIRVTSGFTLRKDWLDKLNLKEPATVDDWYNVLKAFKDKDPNGNGKADELPFVGFGGNSTAYTQARFSTSWGIKVMWGGGDGDFYKDASNKVKYGAIQPAYKDYLATMAKWYKEGLIDPEILAVDEKNFDAKMMGDRGGSYFGKNNGSMGKYLAAWEEKFPNFKLVGVKPPVGPAGKSYGEVTEPINDTGLAITSKNKHLSESVRWADYVYGPEGTLLSNYGIEGQTYKMVSGKPVFTDEIIKNPDKLSVINALSKYTYGSSKGHGFQLKDIFKQIATYPSQVEALERWSSIDPGLDVPTLMPNAEEIKKYSKTMNDIRTYTREYFSKVTMGQDSIDNFDKYVAQVKSMGIADMEKILQDVYDRYQKKQ